MMKKVTIYLLLTTILANCTVSDRLPALMPTNTPTTTAPDTPVPMATAASTATPEATATPDPASLNGLWQTQPAMLYARAAHAVVSTGTAIYVLAGTGEGGSPVLEVERFDGREWMLETTLPGAGLNAPAAVVLDERIYLIGGFNTTSNIPSSEVLLYDLAGKTWDTAAPLPEPRGGHAATILDGKIHVVGGGNSQSTIAHHSVFDPKTNIWSDLAPLPRAQGSPALVAFAGKLYAIGGRSGFSDFGDVYIYDPATDTWTTGAAIEPRGTAGAVVVCDTIYLFGGESQAERKSLDAVLRLDSEQDRWTAVNPMPTARNFARAVLLNNVVYVVGGSLNADSSHSSAGSAVVESFHIDCQLKPPTVPIEAVPPTPVPSPTSSPSTSAELDTATTRLTDGSIYRVSFSSLLDPIAINEIHSWTLHVETADGQPVANAVIGINGGMPEHGHGLPTRPQVTQNLGNGDYLVEGLKFQMSGWWEVQFDISAGGQSDTITFNLVLQ